MSRVTTLKERYGISEDNDNKNCSNESYGTRIVSLHPTPRPNPSDEFYKKLIKDTNEKISRILRESVR